MPLRPARARAGADAVLDAELVEFEGKWYFVSPDPEI
jgi:hypothetical protein